jgi:flagellar biosynthetic protein FliO
VGKHLAILVMITLAAAGAGVSSAQSTQPTAAAATAPTAAGESLIRRSAATTTTASAGAANSIGGSAARVAGSLAVVLTLIVLMYWAAKRLLPQSALAGRSGGGGGAIHVLARTHLSPKQKILIVQVGRRVLVVGDGGGGQLNTLCEIDDADEAAALIGQIQGERGESGGRSFASMFGSAKENLRATNKSSPPDVCAEDDEVESARQQLDGLMQQVRGITRQIDRT